MKIKIDAIDVLVYLSSLFSFVISIAYWEGYSDGYKLMVFLPIVFFIFYFLILQNLRKSSYKFTVYGIIGMEWIRFVLMPPVCALASENVGFSYINPSVNSLNQSILLMIFEFSIISIFSFFWLSSTDTNNFKYKHERLLMRGNRLVYIVFVLFVIFILFTVGKKYRLLNFLYIPVSSSGRIGDLTDTYLVLARQIVIVGLFLLFLWTVSYCKLKYEKDHKNIYVNAAIVIALLNVAIIVGERRTSQIYTTIICMWILLKSFPLHKRKILFSIGTTAFIVLLLMSIYKFFAAFQYNSYAVALSNSSIDISWFSRTLQSYFFGPENVAAVLDFSEAYNMNISNMTFDFLRSVFGVSFFMKGQGVLTSEIFNTYIYGKPTLTGHVISATGYGYIYLGVILSPIIVILNIILCSKVEKKMYLSRSYEMTYVWGYVLVRFATNLFVNTPPLISNGTIMLGTGGLLFITAMILRKKDSISTNYISSSNSIQR